MESRVSRLQGHRAQEGEAVTLTPKAVALLHELIDELAGTSEPEVPRAPRSKARRTRETRAPQGPVDALAVDRATRILRERGITR